MKYLGQHIQNLTSRFRSSIFLENLESSSETAALVVDSNGKITKNASLVSSGTTDLTSDVTGVLPVANGGTGASSLTDTHILIGNSTSAVETTSSFTYSSSAELLSIGNGDNGRAEIIRTNGNDSGGGQLRVTAGRALSGGTSNLTGGDLELVGGAGVGDGASGGIRFYNWSTVGSGNSPQVSVNEIASITGAGNLQIDGGLTTGSTLALNSSGLLQVANQSNITGVGTITSGTWTGSTIAVEYGGTGQTSLTSNSILTGNGTSGITAESNLSYDGTNLTLTSDGISAPDLTIESTASHSTAGNLFFNKFRADDTPPDGMMIGLIQWNSEDDANNAQLYAQIIGSAEETGAGTEGGKLQFKVATHDGELQSGIVIEDGDAEDEIDVTLGSSATSVTTILGTLTMNSTAFADANGVIQVATQGTIDHDSLANFVANEHIDWTASSAGTIHSSNIATLNQDTTGNADTATNLTTGDKTLAGIITMKGLIADGDRSVTASVDGVAIHVDAMDITDSSTSASGTAARYNHITIENPRVMATNSSVTTTDASTLYIKGSPVASTNQTITNAYSIYVNGGNSYFAGSVIAGSIELGHASDTTIARSAAGTVTIEGNTIATTNKLIDCKTAGYWSSTTTGGYYITLGGSSTNESTSLATSSYTAMYVAPYDGKILRITSFHQSSSSRTSTLEVYIDGDDSDLTNDQRGTDMSVSSYGQKFTQDCPADWTFSKGEAIAIKRTDTAAVYGTTMTVVFEYDTTT